MKTQVAENVDSCSSIPLQIIEDQIQEARANGADLKSKMKEKFYVYNGLVEELEKSNRNINRASYTTRIMEVVGNIRKQRMDIDKILGDTREVQKEISSITGQLDRQFTVTDDLLFKNAKRDEYSRRAYKLLIALHSECNELVKGIQESGAINRESFDLDEQIENEKLRNISGNLQQISNDLDLMQQDNANLQEQLKKLSQ